MRNFKMQGNRNGTHCFCRKHSKADIAAHDAEIERLVAQAAARASLQEISKYNAEHRRRR